MAAEIQRIAQLLEVERAAAAAGRSEAMGAALAHDRAQLAIAHARAASLLREVQEARRAGAFTSHEADLESGALQKEAEEMAAELQRLTQEIEVERAAAAEARRTAESQAAPSCPNCGGKWVARRRGKNICRVCDTQW